MDSRTFQARRYDAHDLSVIVQPPGRVRNPLTPTNYLHGNELFAIPYSNYLQASIDDYLDSGDSRTLHEVRANVQRRSSLLEDYLRIHQDYALLEQLLQEVLALNQQDAQVRVLAAGMSATRVKLEIDRLRKNPLYRSLKPTKKWYENARTSQALGGALGRWSARHVRKHNTDGRDVLALIDTFSKEQFIQEYTR